MIIKIYRLENWLYNHHLKILAIIVKMFVRVVFGAVIPPSVSIGKGTFITYHGLGVVMHKNTVIGKNCCIRQHVTIAGGRGGVPIIGDNVEINAGAVIVGPVHIGNYVRIGANAVVIQDIPDNSTAVGVPAKVVKVYEPEKTRFQFKIIYLEDIKMKSIMVTGGCGMIGSNLVKRLVKEGWDVYVADNLWRGKLEYLNDENGKPVIDLDTHFFKKDLSVFEDAESVVGITDYVVHLADIVAGIDYVFSNQGELFRVNNLINSNLFAACRKAGKEKVKGLLYVGTVCSFPLTRQNTLNPEPLHEDELFPAFPESAYGWSKLMGQLEIGYLEKETGIPCCTLMFHNVYGTPTDFGVRSQVIPALIRKAVNYPQEDFVVWGSGEQGRAFIHVNDIVNALVLALDKGWGHGWIQIGPSYCTSIKEIAYKVAEISGKGIKPKFDTTKPEGDKARCADYTKAKEVLGWEPTVSLEEGLRESYRWIEKQIKG